MDYEIICNCLIHVRLHIFLYLYRKEESNFKERDRVLVSTEHLMVSLFAFKKIMLELKLL